MDSESKHSFIGSFLQPPDKSKYSTFAHRKSKKLTTAMGDLPSGPDNQGKWRWQGGTTITENLGLKSIK